MERVRSMQLSRRNRHREEEWQHASTSYAKSLKKSHFTNKKSDLKYALDFELQVILSLNLPT